MIRGPIEIECNGGTLYGVPAQHFHHYFASIVHKACHEHPSPPLAVAVELGPTIAIATQQWLKELSLKHERLPVMLALRTKNSYIRRSYREKVEQLKTEIGKDLHELTPDILKRELNYNEYSLLFLSPSDSIIEAIRCSFELDIPLYGVDLDNMANRLNISELQIESPLVCNSLKDFVSRNMSYTDGHRDDEIDLRREIVMAARLKALLTTYPRVLFTCGLGHWNSLTNLLHDHTLRPAILPEVQQSSLDNFKRVVIHPSIAAPYLDSIPAVALKYENSRQMSIKRKRMIPAQIDPGRSFKAALTRTYRKYFRGVSDDAKNDRLSDSELIQPFEGYLKTLGMLKGLETPNISTIMNAATECGLSEKLNDAIADEFMSIPWTTPGDHPGCPLVMPSNEEMTNTSGAIFMNDGKGGKGDYFGTLPDNRHIDHYIPYKWNVISSENRYFIPGMNYVWNPYEYFLAVLSARALSASSAKKAVSKTVPFEGSLLNGIDMKQSVRAFAKGEEEWFVRDNGILKVYPSDLIRHFPIVWLLNPNDDSGGWQLLINQGEVFKKHVRDKKKLQEIMDKNGTDMNAILGHGRTIRASDAPEGVHEYNFNGFMLWSPPSFNMFQVARWAEMTGYKKAPFSSGISSLKNLYNRLYGLSFEAHHWATVLIMCAIPYAEEFLTIVAPESYSIDREAINMARRYGIRLNRVSLSRFSLEEVKRAAVCNMIPTPNSDRAQSFYKEVEKYLNEKKTEYFDQIPKQMRDFAYDRRL
jgi:hypothetical protein